jgi:TrmH family RNA methyltransferase
VERITSRDNPQVKAAAALLTSARARAGAGLFLCEGPTLLREALASDCAPVTLFAREDAVAALPALPERTAAYAVTASVLAKLCDTVTPQGVAFTLKIPDAPPPPPGPMIALDGLADPGNLGTILRTAEAFGVGVAMLGACADPYGPKAVRAAMGSLFRLQPWRTDAAALAALCAARETPILAATLDPGGAPVGATALGGACVLVGSEAHGVSAAGRALCVGSVYIPMRGAESLNAAVAAAILMWEMRR